ncbi:MAG: FAD-dependent oxidoreductase [Syntrophales bacterium]
MKKKETTEGISRRGFIKNAALGAGVVALAGAGLGVKETAAALPPRKWDKETDVVVVGAGGSGLCAAIEAAGSGAKVLLLEKMAAIGGDTIISGSAVIAGGTSLQKKAGVEDSPERFYQDALEDGRKHYSFIKRDTKILKIAYDKGPELVDWLMSLGVKFLDKPTKFLSPIPRIHYVAPGYRRGSPFLVGKLRDAAVNKGVNIMLQTKLVELITDPQGPCAQKRVIGVTAQDAKGKIMKIKARRGVVLATGGFAKGQDLIKRYYPYLDGVRTLGAPGNTGDGIKAAQDIGANLLLEYVNYGVETIFVGTQKGYSGGLPLTEAPLIVVKKDGKRFIDETQGYNVVTKKMIGEGYKLAYWIFDENSRKENEGIFKAIYDNDVIRAFPSLEALAAGMGLNASALMETVKTYNADVEKGRDSEFGRTRLLKKIETPPFNVFEAEPAFYVTYGGLEINGESQVLNPLGKPIPSLYAAGEVCGCLGPQVNVRYGQLGGLAQGMIFGRIAGKNVAMEKPWRK